MSDKELIQSLGGPSALARELGYEMPDGARRVHNWIRRGIPAHVKVDRPDLFMRREKPHPNAEAPNHPAPPQEPPAEAAVSGVQ